MNYEENMIKERLVMGLIAVSLLAVIFLTAGCGTDGSGKASATLDLGYGENEIGTDNVQSVYIKDINTTTIGYIPDGYEVQFMSDGSAIITKVEEQATINVEGDDNIIINCNGGSCPVELGIDNSDHTSEPTVVEQPEPVIVDNNYTSITEKESNVTTSTITDINTSN